MVPLPKKTLKFSAHLIALISAFALEDVSTFRDILSDHEHRDRDPAENPLLKWWGYSRSGRPRCHVTSPRRNVGVNGFVRPVMFPTPVICPELGSFGVKAWKKSLLRFVNCWGFRVDLGKAAANEAFGTLG